MGFNTYNSRNNFELLIYENLKDDDIMFGVVSQSLSSDRGFTEAIACHFYEKGYDAFTHTIEEAFNLENTERTQTIGKIIIRLKLTCHGPETKEVNHIRLKPSGNRPQQLKPIFVEDNSFDFPLDRCGLNIAPKMMYDDDVNILRNRIKMCNPYIKELLHCQRYLRWLLLIL